LTEFIRLTAENGVAHIRMDDGKVNALSRARVDALSEAVSRAAELDQAILISGRAGLFSAGFDLKELTAGPDVALQLLRAGARLCEKLLAHHRPVVSACGGHAYPMGAFLLLSSDERIGAEGDYRIGLNEVAIGIAVPQFALTLARFRLTPAAYSRTATTAHMYSPAEAVGAGFLDFVCPAAQLEARALERVRQLAAYNASAFARTKAAVRGPVLEALRRAIDEELTMQHMQASPQAG